MLTPAQAMLLRLAAESPAGRVFNVSPGGRSSREATAIRQLVGAGLMDELSCHAEWEAHRGPSRSCVVTTARITDAGREALVTSRKEAPPWPAPDACGPTA